ncbi:aldehyde dehydrogenase family protein [Pseudomonas sp. v388]|nr:aldehyde dehydrogenase family protein [Pseudomonas sp. v388]RRV10825.1 aldehyde dehydrogenase family protein [Pseudomonas sp. v388]
MNPAKLWIDGQWRDNGQHEQSFNPATGDAIGIYVDARVSDVQTAIDAALRAFRRGDWAADRQLRVRVLHAMAQQFEDHAEELAMLLALENGKTLQQARFEVSFAPKTLRFNAALATTDYGRAAELAQDRLSIAIRQPVGVAGIYAPWNSPVALAIRSLGPALAAGCSAVVVLPRQTAQVNALLSQLIAATPGLPAGVVNILTGDKDVINHLVKSPKTSVISFTGSTGTGRAILASAASTLKRVGLELGGKTPIVILEDADQDQALEKVVEALTVFSGQFCVTGSRLLVHRTVADSFLHALAERLEKVRVGPGLEESSQMGPLINKASVKRVESMVMDAISYGAEVIVRGGPITDGPLAAGAFFRPTLLEVPNSNLPIVQEEVFGPVLTVQRFDTEAEAIELANDSEYGLAASVWSQDVDRVMQMARHINAGTVWINDWGSMDDAFEEGGFKSSGLGRLRGLAGLEDFLEYKHIALKTKSG